MKREPVIDKEFLQYKTDPSTSLLVFNRSAIDLEDLNEFERCIRKMIQDANIGNVPKRVFVLDLRRTTLSLNQRQLSIEFIRSLDRVDTELKSLFKSVLCVVPGRAYSIFARTILYFSQFHRDWKVVFTCPQDCRSTLSVLHAQ
jgi:hypothetical protein